MWEWGSEDRERLTRERNYAAEAAESVFQASRAMIEGRRSHDVGFLLRSYATGLFSMHDHLYARIRMQANKIGELAGIIPSDGSFFEADRSVRREYIRIYCPDLFDDMYIYKQNNQLDIIDIFSRSVNEFSSFPLPPPMNMVISRLERAPFRLYSTSNAAVFVHPFKYQVTSKDNSWSWASGSPKTLLRREIGSAEVMDVDRPVVILQDRFVQSNLSHFLFDGVTRAIHYVQRCQGDRQSIFVFGGVPTEYHNLVCEALVRHLSIPRARIVFPKFGTLLRTNAHVSWFSDQVDAYTHPAQMVHPESVSELRRLCSLVHGKPSELRRIYISRADATRRRVANESELELVLKRRGFVTVTLSDMPPAEQIGLFRDAEFIIAPHGMGLTHLVMASDSVKVIELFPPGSGSDAYAFFSIAAKLNYNFVIGKEVRHSNADFTIDIDHVDRIINGNVSYGQSDVKCFSSR